VSAQDVAARPRFVVQLHDATTPSLDLRLHGDAPGTGSRVGIPCAEVPPAPRVTRGRLAQPMSGTL
jgi:hypothetical protein